MKKWWVSWWWTEDMGEFELYSPWWISGERIDDGAKTICAALMASSESQIERIIQYSYDVPPYSIDFRFIEERPNDWSPFNDRFEKADWMQWPVPSCSTEVEEMGISCEKT